jgi:DNA-directed RNA polymerase subunit K/omega
MNANQITNVGGGLVAMNFVQQAIQEFSNGNIPMGIFHTLVAIGSFGLGFFQGK